MSGRHEKPIPMVDIDGGSIMIFGDDNSGNLGSRIITEVVGDLTHEDGLTEEQIARLSQVASTAAARAIRETFTSQLTIRLDFHADDERSTAVFLAERMTHENAVRKMRGEQ